MASATPALEKRKGLVPFNELGNDGELFQNSAARLVF